MVLVAAVAPARPAAASPFPDGADVMRRVVTFLFPHADDRVSTGALLT